MKEVNKEVYNTRKELSLDFNGNSTKILRYLNKRIELFNNLGMNEAEEFYKLVLADFQEQEVIDEQIREANRKNERDVALNGGTWH